MSKRDNSNSTNESAPGLFGIVSGVFAGWKFGFMYAPLGLTLGIFLGTIYENWKKTK